MQKRQLYKELLREYEKKRSAAHTELEVRKAEIYDMVPRIKEIDDEIAALGFKTAFQALGAAESAKDCAKAYKHKCDALIKERNSILKEAGIPRKYLEIRYSCKECGDTGYIGAAECKCFKRRRVEMAYGAYQLKDRLASETFDNFDFRYYSSKKIEGKNETPKKNMEKIVKYCLKFTKDFETKKPSILFFGEPGLGKTFLCNSIAKELMDKGHTVVYITAFSLFKLLNDMQFGKMEDEETELAMDDVLSSELLIVDDVGTEFATVLTGTGFFNIINARALNGLPVIISTNLCPEEMKEQYSERVYSRIAGSYTMFEFYGDDVRLLKKYGQFLD